MQLRLQDRIMQSHRVGASYTCDLNRAVSQSPVQRHIRISFKGFRFASLRGTRHNWSVATVSATGRHCSPPVWCKPYWRCLFSMHAFCNVGFGYCLLVLGLTCVERVSFVSTYINQYKILCVVVSRTKLKKLS